VGKSPRADRRKATDKFFFRIPSSSEVSGSLPPEMPFSTTCSCVGPEKTLMRLSIMPIEVGAGEISLQMTLGDSGGTSNASQGWGHIGLGEIASFHK
jgi:hypothetical protein